VFNHHRQDHRCHCLDLTLRHPLVLCPSKFLFASPQACCRRYADRPPSQADATSAQPPNSCRSTSRTTYSLCQSSRRYSGPHIARIAPYCVRTFRPCFARFPIALSFRIPALPLLPSCFNLTFDTGRHRSVSTCVAYLYTTLSPGPGEGHRRTHAIEPLFPLFPFAYLRLKTCYARYDFPSGAPGLSETRPLSLSLLPCAFAFPSGARTSFGPDLSRNSLAVWTVHLRYNTFPCF